MGGRAGGAGRWGRSEQQGNLGRGCSPCPAITGWEQTVLDMQGVLGELSAMPLLLQPILSPLGVLQRHIPASAEVSRTAGEVPTCPLFISFVRNIICIYRHFIQVQKKKEKRKENLTTSSSPDQQLLSQTHNKCSVPKLNTQERCNMAAHTFKEAVNK